MAFHAPRCPLTGRMADPDQCHGCDGCDRLETVVRETDDPIAMVFQYAAEETAESGGLVAAWITEHGQEYAPPTLRMPLN